MSSQSTKKRRIGSRRRATNQNKTSEADEFLETNSISVAQLSIPGGNEESVNALSNPDKAPSQSENPPSPELSGNRRKLGSSRRSKGGRHVQDSASDSHQKLREGVEEKSGGNQSPEMTQMSLAEQYEGKDCLIKSQDREILSVTHLSKEDIATVYSVKERRDREDSKDMLMQDGSFLSDYLASESNEEPVVERFSHSLEQVKEESSIQQHKETESNELGKFSTSNEEPSTKEEQSKVSYLPEIKDFLQSEQVVSTDGEEMEQMHVTETDNDENLMHEGLASEISENLFNSTEVSDSTGDSSKTQEVLNPDDKQNEKNVKENSEAKNEDYHACDIEKPLTTDKDIFGFEPGEVNEKEYRHDDNMEPSVEQAFHHPKELVVDLSRSSLQMIQSETATNFDSQIQDDTLTVDEHSSGFSTTRNRRKMGSSRRKKESQQIRDPADELYHKPAQEVVECSVDNEDLVTNVSLLTETLLQGNFVENTLEEMTDYDIFKTEKLRPGEDILEGNSSEQHAEAESSVEKAAFPSPEEDLSTVEEQREVFLLSEAKGVHQSEDSLEEALEHGEDVFGTEKSSKLLILNAAENSEIVSDKQINQDKGSDLSQLTKNSADDFATKQGDSNLYEMQEEHPSGEDNFEAFDQSIKDYLQRPQREDKELGHTEGKVEDDIELSPEQTDHLDKEMDNIKSFQTLKSEEHVSLNSKPLPTSNSLNLTADETHHGPKEEDIEMTKDDEALEPKEISLPQEDRLVEDNLEEMDTFGTAQMTEGGDKVQYDADFGTLRNASEETITNVQSSSNINPKLPVESSVNEPDKELYHLFPETTEDKESIDKTTQHLLPDVNVQGSFFGNQPLFNSEERDLSSVLTESHSPQEDTKLECSVENEGFSSPKKGIHTNEELDNIPIRLSKVVGVLLSKDAVDEVHEQGEGVKQTQMQETHYPSERLTNNAADNSLLLSGHQEEQESGSHQSGLFVKSTNFATVLENSDENEQKGALSDDEECKSSLKTLQPHLEDPALHCLNSNEQTHTAFNPVKSHRKLGSSRRYKDRKKDKDSVAELYHEQKEDVEITSVNEEFEPSQKIPETEKISCEELYQDSESNFTMPETDNFSLCPDKVPFGDQNPTTSNYHETDLENLIPVREIPQEDHHERDSDFKVEKSDKSVTGTGEDRDQSVPLQNEDLRGVQDLSQNQDVKPAPVNQQNISKNLEVLSGDLTEEDEISNTYQSELTERVHVSPNSQEDLHTHDKHEGHAMNSTNTEGLDQANNELRDGDTGSGETMTEDILPGQADETEGHIKDELKPLSEKTVHLEEVDLCFEAEKGESLSQTLHLEIHASQSEDQQSDSLQERDSTAESYQSHTEEDIQEARENLPADTTELSLREETEIQEKPVAIILDQVDPGDTAWAKEVGNQGEDSAHVGTTADELPEIGSTANLKATSQSTFKEIPEYKLLKMYSVSEKESTEKDEDKDLSRQVGNFQVNNVESESAFGQELFTEKYQIKEHAENGSVAQAVSTNKEETEHVTLSHVGVGHHSGFSVDEVHEDEVKITQMPEEYRPVYPTSEENVSSGQELWSKMNVPSDSEPQPVKSFGNRRKLGSSRRNKGRQHVKNTVTDTLQEPTEEFVQKGSSDEALKVSTADIFLANDKEKQEESDHSDLFNSTMGMTNSNENSVRILSQNDEDNGAILSADSSRLNKDDLEQVKVTNDPENLSQHTEYDKTDLIQSQNTSALKDDVDGKNTPPHDDEFVRLSPSDHVEQEDDYHNQNKEALTCDKDKDINMQQINDAEVKGGHVTVDNYNADVRAEMDVPVSKNDKVEENLMKKDQDIEDTMASVDITDPEYKKTDSLAPLDSGLLLNFKEEQTGDVDEGSGSENLPEKSKQRKRKFGSSRRLLRSKSPAREQDSKDEAKKVELDAQAEVRNLERVEVMEEFTGCVTAEFSPNENVKPPRSLAHENLQESSESSRILDSERNLQSNISDQPTSEYSMLDTNPPLSSKTEEYPNIMISDGSSVSPEKTTQSLQNDEECVNATQNQTLKSVVELVVAEADVETVKAVVSGGEEQNNTEAVIQEPYSLEEEAHFLDTENENVILNLPQRRRKMGSSRKNPKNQRKTKEEDLSVQQEEDNEAVEATRNAVDAEDEHFSGIKEGEPKVSVEQQDSDSDLKKAVVSETVEYTLTDESHLAPTAPQSSEENPVPESQTEHQLTPNYLPASHTETVKLDEMTESASDGRRRKMGSSRKARAQLSRKQQTAREDKITELEDGGNGGGVTEESNIKAVEEQSLAVPETSKVDKTNKSALETGDDVKPTSEKTPQLVAPVQQPSAEISLDQESQKTLSLADSRLAAKGSNCYNVVMVGNSSVGKTSFMKRAHSGKFSVDIPASIGIDACLWTVVVDGKPVVLKLWDTAGQERFHSITRQIFHKAQAFLLMYDITSSHSFSAVSYWASCIQDGAAEDVIVLLLGNKSDDAKRQVKTQEGETLAKEHNFGFMECSAATGENVIQSLESVARMLSQNADTREEATVLFKEPQKKKSSGCC